MRALQRFAELSRPAQAAVLIALAAAIFAAASLFPFGKALAVFVAGVAAVGLLLLGYEQGLRWLSGRRAAPMEEAIRASAAAAPIGITEPARRARLDDLRKNFEAGIEKFRHAGKNLYALPWYLLVGEPGSGKTEAIRHCNVGFPPGLQDQLQGAGGTLNMNWWFTNHAVILDTAGRLMFEEVEPGATGEWQEFLRLLRRGRPNCPVNGLMLVIPAESLIRDSSDEIERKGGKIAQQLDNIQRSLGVRFPVYVVVTKCDLVNGFREFFDGITDPALQHQIMGWSNPAPLDTPFDPEAVERHLQGVKQRLRRRRLGLLHDPVHTEDPRARRTDQVDALYEFPEAFTDLTPRLQRYLQMIFVAGEWSSRPLFLRGIYFSSSMREGEALDAKLADALGVSVESLPEGKVWDRDRSYFLRDLFMVKMFREKGLVTRAANTGRQQRARRAAVYGAALAGVAMLAAFTYLGFTQLQRGVVQPANFWSAVSGALARPGAVQPAGERDGPEADAANRFSAWAVPLVSYLDASDAFGYRGEAEVEFPPQPALDLPPERRVRARLPLALRAEADRDIRVPWIYYPVALVRGEAGGDLARDERLEACRAVFEASVLRPLLEATRSQLRADAAAKAPPPWSDQSTVAVAQLLRLESAIALREADNTADVRPIELAPLVRFLAARSALAPDKRAAAEADAAALQQTLDALYADASGAAWPPTPPAVSAASPDEIRAWAELFKRSPWTGGEQAAAGQSLLAAAERLDAAETRLLELAADAGPAAPATTEWVESWNTRYAEVQAAAKELEGSAGLIGTQRFSTLVARSREEDDDRREKAARDLVRETEPVKSLPAAAKPAPRVAARFDALAEARRQLLDAVSATDAGPAGPDRSRVATLESRFFTPGAWMRRAAIYAAADAALRPPPRITKPEPGAWAAAIESRWSEIDAGLTQAINLAATATGEAATLTTAASALAQRARREGAARAAAVLIDDFSRHAPASASDVERRIAELAADPRWSPPERPALPLTQGPARFAPEFSPKAAAVTLRDSLAVLALAQEAGAAAPAALTAHAAAARTYLDAYAEYWTDGLTAPGGPLAVAPGGWREFRDGAAALSASSRAAFEPAAAAMAQAAAAAAELKPLLPSDDRAALTALQRLETCAAETQASLRDRRRAPLEEMMGRWAALPAEPAAAAAALSDALRQPGGAERFYEPPPDAEAPDLVLAYFNRASVAGFKALTADPGAKADDTFAALRGLHRFPLAPWAPGVDELTAEQVESARALLAALGPAGPATAAAPGASAPREIAEEIRTLLGSARGTATDRALAAEMSERLKMIPPPGRPATVAIVYIDDPGRAIDGRTVKERAALRLSGERVRNGGLISRDGTRRLGEVPIASGAAAIELFADAAGRQPAGRHEFPTRWLPIYLHDRFPSLPLAATPSVVEPQIRFKTENDEDYGMIIRLEFPAEVVLPAR